MRNPSSHPRLRRRALGAAALLTFGLGTACQTATPAAATVNGHQIPQVAVDSELREIVHNTAYAALIEKQQPVRDKNKKGTFDLGFTGRVLARQILLEIIHEEAVRRQLVLTPAQISTATAAQRAQLTDAQGNRLWDGFTPAYQNLLARRAAEVSAVQEALVPPNAAAVQKYYDANKAKLAQNCASHILVATQALADDVHKQLAAGADIATLAKKYSTDTASAAKGGDLGCAPARTYVAEFEAAMAKLAVGQVSPVVHTQFGYHIIKLTARKTSLAEVRAQVVRAIQQNASTQLSTFVQSAVGKAKITVDPRYGVFDKATGQITPPRAPGSTTAPVGGRTPGSSQTPASTPASTPDTSGGSGGQVPTSAP